MTAVCCTTLVFQCNTSYSTYTASARVPLNCWVSLQVTYGTGVAYLHMPHIFYKKLKNVSCEYNRLNG